MYLGCVMLSIEALLRLSKDKNRCCKELWNLLVFNASHNSNSCGFVHKLCLQTIPQPRRRIKNVGDEIKPVSTLRKIDYDILVLR